MKRAFVCAILLFMPVRSAAPSHARRLAAGPRLAESVQVRAALEWFDRNLSWMNDPQARLTEIPAPPFEEERRASAVSAVLDEICLPAGVDKSGNARGE